MYPNGFVNAHLSTEPEKQSDKHLLYASKTKVRTTRMSHGRINILLCSFKSYLCQCRSMTSAFIKFNIAWRIFSLDYMHFVERASKHMPLVFSMRSQSGASDTALSTFE